MPRPLKNRVKRPFQESVNDELINFAEMNKKTRVSFTAAAISPAEIKFLNLLLMQFLVVPTWIAPVPKGAVIDAPRVHTHRKPKNTVMSLDPLNTALIRK